uniref:Hypothetical chloroplast RF58 n=1 Tax=Gastroclonium compressum TaxID=1852973 RepID=A0A173FZZ4_GASCM|nr:hypothetical chloroplast RF58 [Coeloseira compressa]ANH09601.1 hypothetical chloroplast RF58 [Coeloseira compressa]
MQNKTKFFLESLEGNWLSNQTVYYITTKQIINRKNKNHIKIIENNSVVNQIAINNKNNLTSNQAYHFIFKNCQQKQEGYMKKETFSTTSYGKFKLYSNHCVKTIFNKKNTNYTEYLLTCTKNFQISIGFIKVNKNYIAVKFTSKIKISKS